MSSENPETHQEAASEAWHTLFRLFFAGVGQRRFHEACDATGLAPGALKTLLQLGDNGPQSMRELAETFRCDPSYVTSLVDSLEQAGLAERRLHPTDRRVKVVAITGPGETAKTQVDKILGEPPEALLSLSTDQLYRLADLLNKVAEAEAPAD